MSSSKEDIKASGESLSTQYALHVAIQTMKERCQTLQQRLSMVEEENAKLRTNAGMDRPVGHRTDSGSASEVETLRERVAELTRQKTQLTEHIAMVATENRQLWSRLSKLTKDNQTLGDSLNKMKNTINTTTTASSTGQNLIRSKTFTQNAPSPALRHKLNAAATQNFEQEQLSLEEISLKVLNEFLEGKAEVEKKWNELLKDSATDSIGFGYLNVGNLDLENQQDDIKKCADGMVDIKKELLRQQSDLKVALSRFRQKKIVETCQSCKNSSRKPTMADKNLETDDNMTVALHDGKYTSNPYRDDLMMNNVSKDTVHHVDFIERKRIADTMDKMCPMCGRTFTCQSTFDEFQEHVELHFIDESELDVSLDKNLELISHTVGDF